MARLCLIVLLTLTPSFVAAQTAPTGRLTAATAAVLTDLPTEIRFAAVNADEVATRTAIARKTAAQRVTETHEALVATLEKQTVSVEAFALAHLGFLNAILDAFAADNELMTADAKVITAHLAWLLNQRDVNVTVESAFNAWMDHAIGSYFRQPADATELMKKGEKRLDELRAAERERSKKEREKDDAQMKELRELLDRLMKKPA